MQLQGPGAVGLPVYRTLPRRSVQTVRAQTPNPFAAVRPHQDVHFGKAAKKESKLANIMHDIRFFGRILRSAIMGKLSCTGKGKMRMENNAIFQPTTASRVDQLDSGYLKERIQEVFFKNSDGNNLHGWYIPPLAPDKPTVIISHGNHGNMNKRESILEAFAKRGFGVMAYDYRGFGKSQGKPSEQGVYDDLRSASRYLNEHRQTPTGNQIAMGESLGGAVTIDASQKLPFKAMIVSSTFTNIPGVFARLRNNKFKRLKFLLPKPDEIVQQFQSIEKVPNLKLPVFIAHGDKDDFVPIEMGMQLYANTTHAPIKEFMVVPGGEHSGLFALAPDALMDHIEQFLKKANTLPA